jgi:cob(I)alamin adenosyltransferase
MKIYTKKGDEGQTSILGKKRYSKADLRICSIGEIDELNAHIGLIYSKINLQKETLHKTLNDLFVLGSQLAVEEPGKYKIPEISDSDIELLENQIDQMEASLPQMTHFILPTGDEICAQIHVARSVCRRAERSIVALNDTIKLDANITKYINRLSDYCFVLARYYCFENNINEVKWIPNK